MSSPDTFATLWLAKGLNTIKLPAGSPLVNTNKRSTPDLLRQANKQVAKGKNRKVVTNMLNRSTLRSPAHVVAPPMPAAGAQPSSNGGGGYSGNVAAILGQASNPGTVQALPLRPPSVT